MPEVRAHAAGALAFGCAAFLLPAGAAAAPGASPSTDDATPVELSWVRLPEAAECPPAEEVRADVERRLGHALLPERRSESGAERRAVSIEVLVSRKPEGFRADIAMRSADGTFVGSRLVSSDSPTCTSLGAAAALAVSIMLRPLLTPPEPEAPPEREAPPPVLAPPKPAEPPPPPSLPPPAPKEASGASVGFSLGALGASGVLPKLALGLESAAELTLSPASGARATVDWFPAQRIVRAEGALSFSATIIGLAACYEPQLMGAMSLRGCAGPFLEALAVAVERPKPVGGAVTWSSGVRAGAELAWALGPAGVVLGVHALVPWSRRDYLVRHAPPEPPTSFFRQPPASGLLLLGLRMPAPGR